MSVPNPDLRLQRLANAYQISRAVQVAARLGLGRLLSDGATSAAELARCTDTDQATLLRLLRLLAQLEVVEELPGDSFGPTPLSDRLHRVDNIAQGEEAWGAWGALPEALCTGRPVFASVHGRPFYEYAAAHPEQLANWRESNGAYAEALAPGLVNALDLAGTESVVDVGGGQGALLAQILREHPACRGFLCDLPEALVGAPERLAGAGVAERCEIVAGDAFEGLPKGLDVYLLSRVVFNWQDEEVVQLLGRCRRSMAAGGRVLVVEPVMPESAGPERRALAAADLHHLLLWGGGYRTRSRFEILFRRAGLRLSGARAAEASGWTVLEGSARQRPSSRTTSPEG